MMRTRRSVLALIGRGCAALVLGAWPGVLHAGGRRPDDPADPSMKLAVVVSAYFRTPKELEAAVRLGRETPSMTRAELEQSLVPPGSVGGSHALRAHLAARCSEDLRHGRVCSVKGWVVPRTEAALLRAASWATA